MSNTRLSSERRRRSGRLLFARLQIAQKYDSLPPEQKQEFDKKAEEFLSAGSPDAVIVHVTYMANSQTNELELARHWQSRTTDTLKNSVYLISSKGVRVPLAQYAVAQGGQHEFQFIFPRQYDGKPILGPDDKSLKLEFAYPIVDTMGDGRAFMEFKVQKDDHRGENRVLALLLKKAPRIMHA